jgi:hypothetical protein
MLDENLSSDAPAQPVPLEVVAETGDLVEAAVEVLMMRHQVPHPDAAQLLRQASEDMERPLQETAEDVVRISLPASGVPTRRDIRLRSVSRAPAKLTSARVAALPVPAREKAGPPAARAAVRLLRLLAVSDLPELLDGISELAVTVVAGCRFAGIRVIRDGQPALVASSDASIHAVDEIQFRTGDGPYLQAIRTSAPVYIDAVDDVDSEAWRCAAKEAGITASMSLPLPSPPDVVAVLSLHSTLPTGWPREARPAARDFAEQVGLALMIGHHGSDLAKDAQRPETGIRRRKVKTGANHQKS